MRHYWPPRLLLALGFLASAAVSSAQTQDTLSSFQQLTVIKPNEPWWSTLMRMRANERFIKDTNAAGIYLQIRSQAEARVGNHLDALRMFDLLQPPGDSVGSLPTGVRAVDAVTYLASMADTARVIMINERHHASTDRLVTLRLLPLLRAKGYRYFAAEALDERDSTLARRGYPIEGLTGTFYVEDPVFAEVLREALRLGYNVVPYESSLAQNQPQGPLDTRPTSFRRDSAQAANLVDRVFRRDATAKVLVHAGYAHIEEHESPAWHPMAWYFRRLTGIDPVTVDQTVLSERSAPSYEHPLYRAIQNAHLGAGVGLPNDPVIVLGENGKPLAVTGRYAVDLEIVSARTQYDDGGRPTWMTLGGGRRATPISTPECATQWCLVEARMATSPDNALVLDRVEVMRRDRSTLYLPARTSVRIRILAMDGRVIRTITSP
ncbi:MAG: hypothetical protein ABJE47_22790 [bacterium]